MAGFDLTGRVAIVTGGSQGIGRAIALALADAGADVAIVARLPETVHGGAERIHRPVEAVAQEIEAKGRRSLGVVADVRDESQITKMVSDVREAFGKIDILVNNAGATWGETFRTGPLLELSAQDLDECLRLNLRSVFLCSCAVAPVMLAQGQGAIVNLASGAGRGPSPNNGVYGAAKAGVISLTQTMSVEWAPAIRVNAIAPGTVDHTDRAAVHPYALPGSRGATGIALGRVGTAEDMAGAVAYLASDAAAYTTGTVIDINGGGRTG